MTEKQRKLVKKAVKLLISISGRTTTLEVKKYLRIKHPDYKWVQHEVSDEMMNLKKLDFTDNGVYRTYFKGTPPKKAKKLKKAPKKMGGSKVPKSNKVSATKMVNLIANSKGRFFTITFTKQDGSTRVMNGQVKASDLQTPLGNLKINERKGKGTQRRQVNPKSIKELTLSGTTYYAK